jgi:hypothetical protein
MKIRSLILPVFVVLGTMSHADPAVIEGVSAQKNGPTWTFSVTLRHGDTGWDDYADGWRIVSPNGDVLGTRVLFHPHENEQPFTRSHSGIEIPQNLTHVFVEARTLPDGWTAEPVRYDLR